MKHLPLIAVAALFLTGCSTSDAPEAISADATPESVSAPADETAAEDGGLAKFTYEGDWPMTIAESWTHEGFDYDGIHIKYTGAEVVADEDATFWVDEWDTSNHTPIMLSFILENTTDQDFPLEHFGSGAVAGPNLEEVEEVGEWAGERELHADLPRQIAAGNEVEYFKSYYVSIDQMEEPFLMEISPTTEGPIVEYYLDISDPEPAAS